MNIEITKKEEVNVVTLQVEAEVRYWEDAIVNGVSDDDGVLIPFRSGDNWSPKINLDTGRVLDWPQGIKADIHYKVCDAGIYTLLDENGKVVFKKEGYVPDILCPKENGYGDYIIMYINENGQIADFVCDLSGFSEEED